MRKSLLIRPTLNCMFGGFCATQVTLYQPLTDGANLHVLGPRHSNLLFSQVQKKATSEGREPLKE